MIGSKIVKKTVENIYKRHITVQKSLCSRIRYKHSNCSYCMDACPVNAIGITGDEVRISNSCIECGVCYSACPNSVFGISGRDDLKSLLLIKEGLKRINDRVLRIRCEQMIDERKGILKVPCLGRLTEELILGAFLYGAHSVQILKPECNWCPLERASSRFLEVFVLSQDLINALQMDSKKIRLVENFGDFKEPSIDLDTPVMDRRGFFKSIGGKTISVTEKALKIDNSEELEGFIYDKRGNQKRHLLISITEKLYPVSKPHHLWQGRGKSPVLSNGVNSKDRQTSNIDVSFSCSDVHFGEVSINSSLCTGCGVCVTLCPSGALKARIDHRSFSIFFTKGLCINCRLCADACHKRAIKITMPESVKDALGLGIKATERESLLLEKQKKVCPRCESPFYTDGEYCISCLKHKEKTNVIVNSILSMEVEK